MANYDNFNSGNYSMSNYQDNKSYRNFESGFHGEYSDKKQSNESGFCFDC